MVRDGQRREVHAGAGGLDVGRDVAGPLAHRIDQPIEAESAGPHAVAFGRGDEELRHVRHTAQRGHADLGARRDRPERDASRGRRSPRRRRSPRFAPAPRRVGRDPAAGSRCRQRRCWRRPRRGAGSSKSTTSRSSSTGNCSRMPAPSPLLGSAPAAPRCSRCSRAVNPSATMLCERRPLMSATIATPHESRSCSGSYKTLGLRQRREQHLNTPPQQVYGRQSDCAVRLLILKRAAV